MSLSAVYNARNNLLAVLAARGYDVSEYDAYSISHVSSMMENSQLDLLLETPGGKKIFVKYCLEARPNLDRLVDDFFPSILSAKDDLLLICNDDMNDAATEYIETLFSSRGLFVCITTLKRLQFNVLEHSMVPKHSILGAEDRVAFLEEYQIKSTQLPEISRFDAVAAALGMRPGDICKIERSSKTALVSDYYRVCV